MSFKRQLAARKRRSTRRKSGILKLIIPIPFCPTADHGFNVVSVCPINVQNEAKEFNMTNFFLNYV